MTVTNVHRRAMLTMTAATVSAGPVAAAQAISRGQTDARLLARIADLRNAQACASKANAAFDVAWDKCEAAKPERPAALRWHLLDPRPLTHDIEHVGDNKCRLWCNYASIEKLRETPMLEWKFLSTDRDYERLSADDFVRGDYGEPKPHIAHLFKARIHKRHQERKDEVIAAHDAYQATVKATRDRFNVGELGEATDKAWAKVFDLSDEITEMPAVTIEGIKAKATLLRLEGLCDVMKTEDVQDDRLLQSLMRDLTDEVAS